LICKAMVREGEWVDSGLFQSFAEKVRKNRNFKEFDMTSSG